MNRIQLALNLIFAGAIAFLIYNQTRVCKKEKSPIRAAAVIRDSGDASTRIAYIELDSMYEQIPYIKSLRRQMESEQRAIESEWEAGYRGLENKKNEFLKKGASITDEMAQEFQGMLLQEKDRIDMRKDDMVQKLSEKQYRFMEEFQKKLKDFLDEYNSGGQFTYILTTGTGLEYMAYKDSSYNITGDVVSGMIPLLGEKKK